MTRLEAIPELDTRFSAPDATTTSWDVVRQLLESAELFWISGIAHVFEVRPHKVLAFAKDDFAQTRFRFTGGDR